MHEILGHLATTARVLDLGCREGSFARASTPATVVRADLDAPSHSAGGLLVQADAAALPFANHSFAAVISNHSLEHFEKLDAVLAEIARILEPGGALFISVPDASTLTDKIYRWLADGGGHVNPFTSAEALAARIERATGLKLVATRTLHSSLSFLNRHNATGPRPRRFFLVGGGTEASLLLYSWLSRRLDRFLGTRLGVYGWAFYFGQVGETPDTQPWVNVCIRCGNGVPADAALARSRRSGFFRVYACGHCGALNVYSP